MKKDMQQAAPVIPQLHEQQEQHQQRSDVKIESSSTSTLSAPREGASSSGDHPLHHSNNPSFDHQEEAVEMGMNWEEADAVLGSIENGDLLNVDDAFMSYEDFPPLPDFPCISANSSSSSSNSSSSAHHHQQQHASSLVTRTSSISSSSATSSACSSASWARIKSDHNNNGSEEADIFSSTTDHDHQHASLLSSLDDSMDIHDPHEDQGADDIIHRMNTADCMDVMEGLGDMGLLDPDELWDPSSLFPPYDEQQDHHQDQQDQDQKQQQQLLFQQQDQILVGSRDDEDDDDNKEPSEDLAMVFLEWLKSNKESISAEDLRSIKLKRSTIESAAKRLGGGKEGMKQLVKLILEWVQNHHLQKRRLKEAAAGGGGGEGGGEGDQAEAPPFLYRLAENPPPQNPNLCFPPPSPWASSLPHPHQQPPFPSPQAQAYFPPMFGYMHGANDPNSMFPHPPPFSNNPNLGHVNPYSAASSASTDHYNNMFVDSSSTSPNWPQPQPPPPPPPPSQHFRMSTSSYHQDSHLVPPPPPPPTLSRSFSNYPCQVFQGSSHGEGSLIRLGSSATKEARKKRMARQRKVFSHHRSSSTTSAHHHHHHPHQQQQHQSHHQMPTHTDHQQQTTSSPNLANNPQAASNWVYWPSSPTPSSVVASIDHPPLVPMQQNQPPQQRQQQIALERRHGCKPAEKNLKFLLQKVLKQSDVGNLGRIVLPKKEAETYLPELEARDGISIAMEDIGTSRVWNMRYRFWPNNKSRMYLLENTGDFVRSNGLQEGDFIVIYSDIKCGKYMIRGVKVRQPGSKCETKKSSKAHRNMHSNSMGFDGSSPIKQAVT